MSSKSADTAKSKVVLATKNLAFDAKHVFALLLAVACVVVPIVAKWVGPLSLQTVASVLPGALLSVWALLQKSPRDLAEKLLSELEPKDAPKVDVVIVEKEEEPKKPN